MVFVTTALATTLCFAASASAATRYASPNGVGSPVSCLADAPCSLADATGDWTEPGDVVILKAGNYSLTSVLLVHEDIEIRGTGAPPATTITSTAPGGDAIATFSPGVELSDLKIVGQSAVQDYGFTLSMVGGTARRLIVTNNVWSACRTQDEYTLFADTVCATSAPDGSALYTLSANTPLQQVRLRGVTAVNTSGSGYGVAASASQGHAIDVDAKSIIASGGTADIEIAGGSWADDPPADSAGNITLDHSNYRTVERWNSGTATPAGSGTNQITQLVFAHAANFDFSLDADSAAINNGALDEDSGSTDVLGNPRGDSPDIGAYERDLVAPSAPVLASPSNGAVLSGWPTIAGTAEPGTKVSIISSQGYGVLTYADEFGNWSASGLGMEPGALTITIQSGDESGNWSSEVTVNVTYIATTPPAPQDSGNAPSVLPRDTTPPKLTLLQWPSPKRIERKITLEFSSNERGSKFLCKLDSASYKPCGSPYRKTVKLGKHKVMIVAIDKAGNRSKVKTVKFRVVKFLP